MRAALLIAFLSVYSSVQFAQQSKPGEALIAFVKSVQVANVKASTAPDALHCVTDDDLMKFEQQGRAATISRTALNGAKGKQIVADLRVVAAADRTKILSAARTVSRPTWAQLGRIPPDGSGQTDAGQREELLVADEIVNQIEEALKK